MTPSRLIFAALLVASAALPAVAQQQEDMSVMPLLSQRTSKGPNGYTLGALTKNLDWTQQNLHWLMAYISPPKEGRKPPAGADLEAAMKALASESAAATSLIADGDAAIAKGIPRDLKTLTYGRSKTAKSFKPNPAHPASVQKLLTAAMRQGNVLGLLESVIQLKRLKTPAVELEAASERSLEKERKFLAE